MVVGKCDLVRAKHDRGVCEAREERGGAGVTRDRIGREEGASFGNLSSVRFLPAGRVRAIFHAAYRHKSRCFHPIHQILRQLCVPGLGRMSARDSHFLTARDNSLGRRKADHVFACLLKLVFRVSVGTASRPCYVSPDRKVSKLAMFLD